MVAAQGHAKRRRDHGADGSPRGRGGDRAAGAIVNSVGPIEYWFVQKGVRIHKTVHYWLMEPIGGDLSLHDHEFDEVRWVSVDDAPDLMSFPTERELVARARPLADEVTEATPRARRRCIAAPGPGRPTHRFRRLVDARPVPGHPRRTRAGPLSAGLFDLSHMGELWVGGPDAGDGLAHALVSDPRALAIGRAHYSMMCAPDGGIIDDLIVYRVGR